ncbi:MAG: 23S rRNA (uracil(1939)-C(5))-methyltransferase RlmD [Bacilli bacterium]|nr:23S rRNA (uracil(1939)-C(5))-methyltransferase RlmD [Bacilli bacterium]
MKANTSKNINKIFKLDISDINYEGMGISNLNDKCVFVEGAIAGENVDCMIDFENKSFYRGHTIKVNKESKLRNKNVCEVYDKCGGCQLQHLQYEASLNYKKKAFINTMKRIGAIELDDVNIIAMDYPYKYRNKVQIPAAMINGKLEFGYFKKRSHDIIPFKTCMLESDEVNDVVHFIRNILNELNIDAYNEELKTGIIRHLMIRENKNKELMIVFVIRGNKFKGIDLVVNKLINRYKNIVSIIVNYNNQDNNVILGEKAEVVYGSDCLIDEILGLKFKISHYSFFQVNRIQTEKLYSKVLEYSKGSDIIIDAYCGVGSISLNLAKTAKHVYGIEVVSQAIDNANENMQLNNIKNASFILGKVEDKIFALLNEVKIDCLVIDPPRKGIDIKVIEAIKKANIKKIVYVSCNPSSLARDLSMLHNDYEIKDINLVDMFAYTTGLETVALLEKKN